MVGASRLIMTAYPQAGTNIRTTVTPTGLIIITETLPYIRSVALGLAFRLGSRDDPQDKSGMAHLIEHMVFKGTPERDARSISIAAESHGAELNAFTDKELTCFYGRFLGDQQVPMTELLAEIIARPAFAPSELAKEKQVVAEEIKTSNEDPDTKAVNLMLQAFYGDHTMAAPIVGTIDSVGHMDDELLRSFYQERYHCGNGVAVAVGDIRHEELTDTLARVLENRHQPELPARKKAEVANTHVLVQTRQDLSQVYLCLARPAFPYSDPRRYALSVLNTALGGGMSSRLFQRLREEEALVYSVSSFVELYGDSGLIGVYFVTDKRKLEQCIRVLDEEIKRLRTNRLEKEEFERACNMTKSAVLLGLESPTTRMLRLARTHHMLGRLIKVDETLDAYNRLGLDEVNGLVDEIFDNGDYHIGAVGPITAEKLEKVIGHLNS